MILGFLLVTIALIVMVALGYKANHAVRVSRKAGLEKGELTAFGYKQELLRDMGGFSNFAISFSIISILTGPFTLYGYGFNQGGPAVIGIGWPLVTLFVLFVAAAMAELASAIPTSGAIYHWASIFGGPGAGWYAAWLNMVGQVTVVAGIDFGCASFAATLLFGEPTKVQLLTVYIAILLSHAVLNHVGIRVVAKLNDISAIYHVFGVAALVGILAYIGPQQDVSYLFQTGFSTVTGPGMPYWLAFLFGFLLTQWTIAGYDASAHTSEETIDARVRAPWGVYLSVALSGFFGYLMLALVTLSIKDPQAVAAAGNNAFITVMEQAVGGTFGRVVLWMVTIAMWFCGLSSVTSASRMIYAFSRDNGMPFSYLWSRVSHRYRTPATAIWLVVVLAFLSALADNVYAVVTSVSVIGLYGSYAIPLALKLRARFKGAWADSDDGPWNLGKWSTPVNVAAVLWIAFITILFVIAPSDVPLTSSFTLHYATGTAFALLLIILTPWYILNIRRQFEGPRLGRYVEVRERIRQGPRAASAFLSLEDLSQRTEDQDS
ncbi:amino acid permease [Kyrpidia spormannii]|uniref:Amino acid transporter n=1 Tax=Kyrpidia spormannii TaxID=2055160 RepID=A0ACA8ZBE5_9BACL|nr:amino acid permease [Kyrpidia spormannii]CAB3394333.1 Amino acid transporter [Kyrpidia spormannii]